MKRDEHELLVEYSEMTTFNFNSKEYQEIKKDFIKFRKIAFYLENFIKNLVNVFNFQHSC